MLKYTKIGVNTISLVISIFIFLLIDLFIFNQNFAFQSNFNSNIIQEKNISNIKVDNCINHNNDDFSQLSINNVEITIEKSTEDIIEDKQDKNIEDEKIANDDINWRLEIPSIFLIAEIREGTTNEIMNNFVGHFEETSKTEGNIGLAAHNRGYPNNYFQNLKKLKEGDEIIYKYNGFQKTYIVETHKIIDDIDWSYLEEKEENTITLITCVENEPNYRRCVQAVEKIEE